MLCVHKHRDTSLRDDKCGCTQYDDEGDHGEHDTKGSTDLRTSLQTTSLTREGPGGVRATWGSTLACRSWSGKYYTSIVVRTEKYL